jgi:glyoxylase-like metal-dependent hydrolase (beta-lactamase superfamily II)
MLTKPFPHLENIHAVVIPFVGFPDLITANVYVLGRGPLTLIDAGPKIKGSMDFLRRELNNIGFDFKDIEKIIVTHGHVDHFGLAARIREAAGHAVGILAHPEEKWRMSTENFEAGLWSQEVNDFMVMAGTPEEDIEEARKRFRNLRNLAEPLDEVDFLEEGEEFEGCGFCLKVIHTPGHTAGSMCLLESQSGILFTGDTIIKHISPNPVVEPRRKDLRDPSYQSLAAYLGTLDKLKSLDVDLVFPGHGEYVRDLRGIIQTYLTHHEERMDIIWMALKKRPSPIYNLVNDVFPYIPEDHILLGISEIISHLEVLINQRRASVVGTGPPTIFCAL